MKGFTFLEICLVLVILSILTSISFPFIRSFYVRAYDQTLQNELLTAIEIAGHEARNRGVPVTLCASENRRICNKKVTRELILFVDENEKSMVSTPDQLLSVFSLSIHKGYLNWRAYPRYRQALIFHPGGLLRSDNSTFWYCHEAETSPVWAIILNQSGRARVVRPDRNGIIKDSHEQPLLCD